MQTPPATIQPDPTSTAMHHVLIGQCHVGSGYERECQTLADELNQDEGKRRWLLDLEEAS